jgi:hypothetical protein
VTENGTYRRWCTMDNVRRLGLFLLVTGVIAVTACWWWGQQPTGDSGANIGAGLGIIYGAAAALIGFLVLLFGEGWKRGKKPTQR